MPTRRHLIALLLSLALLPTAHAASDDAFLPYTDIPLAPGLTIDRPHWLTYDTPHGTIHQGDAIGHTSCTALTTFYHQSLPPLGWKATGSPPSTIDYQHLDQKMQLRVLCLPAEKGIRVRFAVQPLF